MLRTHAPRRLRAHATTPRGLQKHLRLQEIAEACHLPCLYLVDSGGANLPRQVRRRRQCVATAAARMHVHRGAPSCRALALRDVLHSLLSCCCRLLCCNQLVCNPQADVFPDRDHFGEPCQHTWTADRVSDTRPMHTAALLSPLRPADRLFACPWPAPVAADAAAAAAPCVQAASFSTKRACQPSASPRLRWCLAAAPLAAHTCR